MQIIATAVIKGGTGKSTTAAALAQAAQADKRKVLCIDTDPQGNLSDFIGADLNRPGTYQLLAGAEPGNVIQETEQGIDVIAASPDLATITTETGSAKRLQKALEPIKQHYDFIFIDTPPTMGEMTYNALQASTGLIIPLLADKSSLQGLYQITDIAKHLQQRSNPYLSIIGTVITRYDNRPNYNRFLRDTIRDKGQEIGARLLGVIPAAIAIVEAQGWQESIYNYAPRSTPAAAYREIYNIITNS